MKFWAGSAEIERRLRAHSAATAAVVVFIEHVPFALRGWLEHQLATGRKEIVDVVTAVQDQLLGAAKQMRFHDLVHFDAHLGNVLTTGQHLIVSDFGLVAAADFQLDDAERQFLTQHADHDIAYCAAELTNALLRQVMSFPDARARNDWIRMCAQTGTVEEVPDSSPR